MKKFSSLLILCYILCCSTALCYITIDGLFVDSGFWDREDSGVTNGTTATWLFRTIVSGGEGDHRARSNLTGWIDATGTSNNNGKLNDIYAVGAYARSYFGSDAYVVGSFSDIAVGDSRGSGAGNEIAVRNWTGQEAPTPEEYANGSLFGSRVVAYPGGYGSSKNTTAYSVESYGNLWAFKRGIWFGPESVVGYAVDCAALGSKVPAIRVALGQRIYFGDNYLYSNGKDLFWNGVRINR